MALRQSLTAIVIAVVAGFTSEVQPANSQGWQVVRRTTEDLVCTTPSRLPLFLGPDIIPVGTIISMSNEVLHRLDYHYYHHGVTEQHRDNMIQLAGRYFQQLGVSGEVFFYQWKYGNYYFRIILENHPEGYQVRAWTLNQIFPNPPDVNDGYPHVCTWEVRG